MSAAKRDPRTIIPFGLSAFAASLFALGLALGTTIAVGMLFIIQVSLWLLLQTSQKMWLSPLLLLVLIAEQKQNSELQ